MILLTQPIEHLDVRLLASWGETPERLNQKSEVTNEVEASGKIVTVD